MRMSCEDDVRWSLSVNQSFFSHTHAAGKWAAKKALKTENETEKILIKTESKECADVISANWVSTWAFLQRYQLFNFFVCVLSLCWTSIIIFQLVEIFASSYKNSLPFIAPHQLIFHLRGRTTSAPRKKRESWRGRQEADEIFFKFEYF